MRAAQARLRSVLAAVTVLGAVDVASARADVLLFPARQDVRTRLIARIRAEQVRLDVATWYLTDRAVSQAIVEKHRSGVPVRVLGDRVSVFENDAHTKREFEFLAAAGVPIRLRYHPASFPEVMHWKATIFVGQNLVEFGSANYTVYELRPWSSTHYNDEVALFTTDAEIVNAFKTQFDRLWADRTMFEDFARACALEEGGALPVLTALEGPRLEPDHPMPRDMVWAQGPELSRRVVSEIRRERKAIDMVVYRLTDASITRELVRRHRAGVRVRVIVEPEEYNRSAFPEYEMTRARIDTLWAAGIPVRQRAHRGLTHMKTVITSRVALVGSSNFTNNWQRDHNYFIHRTARPSLYDRMKRRFEAMWIAVRAGAGDAAGRPAFRRFRPGRPGPARLIQPAPEATDVPLTPRFEWQRARWAVAYDVYVGTSASNLRRVARVRAVVSERPPSRYSWTPSSPLPAGTRLLWRVVSRTNATRKDPRMIAGSSIRSFTTTTDDTAGAGPETD